VPIKENRKKKKESPQYSHTYCEYLPLTAGASMLSIITQLVQIWFSAANFERAVQIDNLESPRARSTIWVCAKDKRDRQIRHCVLVSRVIVWDLQNLPTRSWSWLKMASPASICWTACVQYWLVIHHSQPRGDDKTGNRICRSRLSLVCAHCVTGEMHMNNTCIRHVERMWSLLFNRYSQTSIYVLNWSKMFVLIAKST
jgi:hypothetical protein